MQNAGEIWTKSYGPKFTKFRAFWQKTWVFKKSFLTKRQRHFSDVCVAETIVSKNYGSPTPVTWLKVAPNMADPTSMKHSVSSCMLVVYAIMWEAILWNLERHNTVKNSCLTCFLPGEPRHGKLLGDTRPTAPTGLGDLPNWVILCKTKWKIILPWEPHTELFTKLHKKLKKWSH